MKQKILTIPSSETSPLTDVLLKKLKERQEFIARLDQDNKDLSAINKKLNKTRPSGFLTKLYFSSNLRTLRFHPIPLPLYV